MAAVQVDFLFYSAPSSPRSAPPDADEFQFDFGGCIPALPAAADELFHAGKILPLKPHHHTPSNSSPPKRKPNPKPTRDFDAAPRSGRSSSPSPRRHVSRSLSPLRVSEFALQQQNQQPSNKKWKLKDLLLFRSASEGSRRPTRKASVGASMRFSAADATTSGEGSSRRRSAHEIHYAANRAASEDLKKRTSLPYKFGLLGCLGFNNLSSSSSSSGFQQFSTGFDYNLSR